MSVIGFDSHSIGPAKRHSLVRRLAYGPALILALCVGSSGVLVAALALSQIFQF